MSFSESFLTLTIVKSTFQGWNHHGLLQEEKAVSFEGHFRRGNGQWESVEYFKLGALTGTSPKCTSAAVNTESYHYIILHTEDNWWNITKTRSGSHLCKKCVCMEGPYFCNSSRNKTKHNKTMNGNPTNREGWVAWKSSIFFHLLISIMLSPMHYSQVCCFITDNPEEVGSLLSHWGAQSLS